MSRQGWELVWLMLILKIPIAYLCWVVWWAIKAEPLPPEGAKVLALNPEPCPFRPGRPRSPCRGPRPKAPSLRRQVRARRAVSARLAERPLVVARP